MPEYLAPGVYVEEVSFRSKSIEGVSTSTTGFVGPTLKGPISETPELLTSFGDFERIYGGLVKLDYGVNYLAHAVQAYFNEGGARLYVSRAFKTGAGTGVAHSADLLTAAGKEASFIARVPGAGGNGRITLQLMTAPAVKRTLDKAPQGTMIRVGSDPRATPARLQGGAVSFALPNDGVLKLSVGGAAVTITFHGVAVEVTGDTPLANPVPLAADNNTLQVTIDGEVQTLTLPAADTAPETLTVAINALLRGGYARLTADNRLVIGSDKKGKNGIVIIAPNAVLGFTAADPVTTHGTDDAANNVGDIAHVTAAEINELLRTATAANPVANQARAALSGANRLLISTVITGETATLSVDTAAPNSVHALLGLTADPVTGTGTGTIKYYVKKGNTYEAEDDQDPSLELNIDEQAAPEGGAEFLSVTAIAEDHEGQQVVYEGLSLSPAHPRWMGNVLPENPSRRADSLTNLYYFTASPLNDRNLPFDLRAAFFTTSEIASIPVNIGGNDGQAPDSAAYATALTEFEKLEDISIVAAPGSCAYPQEQAISNALRIHAEKRRSYRIAVLDTPDRMTPGEVRALRGKIDSTYAALYYPWVVVSNPLADAGDESEPRELPLPPSGFVCGIYARNDIQRGVFKAPANEVVRSALRFENDINFAQQESLNPLGINCLRYLSGRGYRVWGARTASSDPEWKYVSVRRYFNYLEASIDRGTQWAVFEPNGERLWSNIRDTISSFLRTEWLSGALLGSTPEEAYFVRCDRSTMTQNDLDNGRLICQIGVAVVKPAEFVIFRIGQKTADARN